MKGQEPPPDNSPDIPAPPYPGPPLDPSVLVTQTPPAAQPNYGPAPQQHPQQHPQQYSQQHPQQHPQPIPQQFPQQIVEPAPQSVPHVSGTVQYSSTPQQVHVVHPVNQVVVVQQGPTNCPGKMLCPHCQTTVVTVTKHKPGLLTWIICGSLGIIGCWPFCLIPFCVPDCQDVEHHCPTCQNVLWWFGWWLV
ncbi:lipopolysaccharide-induced tumor necrosis factor-alpha factor homolog [Nothobranchius furzeri]|uniref:Lipopolysaccharide-induced tumor necrosis factor-alpha factor homolog n=1 Tax=Nothobranchius furzeri TaxID=105023 RepID=A0A8C6LWD6_NOTFU